MLKHGQVRLRSVDQGDVERVYAWMNDAEVCRWLLRRQPISRKAEISWLDAAEDGTRSLTPQNILLAIEICADGATECAGGWRHVGNVGLHAIDWKNRSAELGIVIGERSVWGRGVGRDAIAALLEHAFCELGLHRVQLGVFAANGHARRCYDACGFVAEGTVRDKVFRDGVWHDEVIMSVLDREFFSRRQQQQQQ